ncbi:hypothetical protein [Photorhabdus hainanensis]|uniref:hypothetical protein n=1 Tax=Photorhabdus hainanensis TaxID=1004166 RepID=UPI001FED14DF|nr:hypothetical protein [Photorhabdus hainanensis]
MLLNKRNIDFCYSHDVGKNIRDQQLKMRADKLSVVSRFNNRTEMKETYTKLESMNHCKYKKYRVQYILEMRNPFERLHVYSKDLGDELLGRGYLYTLPNAPSIAEMKRYMMEKYAMPALASKSR